jgi:1-acyl-sn-glycerol-3-phosphate acyltransferase
MITVHGRGVGGIALDLATPLDTARVVDNAVTCRGEEPGVAKQRRGWAMALCVTLLRRPLMILTKRSWKGGEHLPASGGCVVVTNHVSETDPLFFAHFIYDSGRLPRFLGKAEVFKVPVVGRILHSAGQIPVYRKTTDAAKAFSAAVAAVQKGECVIVYPEGTISRDPGLWPMIGKSGAARIALTAGAPVIPCAQWGPQEVLAPYARKPRLFPRKVMRISAGPAVDLSDLAGEPMSTAVLREATNRIMAAVVELLEDIRGEEAPMERYDPKVHGVADIGNPNDPHNKNRPKQPPAAGETA